MDMVDQIKKLDMSIVGVGLFSFIATIGPGLLLIFLYDKELVVSLDVIKLSLLSGAITLPIIFANIIGVAIIAGAEGRKKLKREDEWFFAVLWTIFCLYGPILISCFSPLSVKQMLFTIVEFEIALFILAFVGYRVGKMKK